MIEVLRAMWTRAGRVPGTLAAAFVLAVILALGARYAWCSLFTTFEWYDDEGHFMISIASCNRGLALYDQVFSQHGPLLYLLSRVLFAGGLLPLDHAHVRILVWIAWLGTVLLSGAIVYGITRSIALAAASSAVLLLHLTQLVHEPGHPQGLIVPLLALAAFLPLVLAERRPGALAAASGAIAGCLLMCKINVGVFAFVSLALAFLHLSPPSRVAKAARRLLWGAALLLPAALMRPHLDDDWTGPYCVAATVAVLGSMTALGRAPPAPPFAPSVVLRFLAAALATLAAICGLTLLRGTSVGGLIHGVVLQHARFAADTYNPAGFRGPVVVPAIASVVLLATWLVLERRPGRSRVAANVLLLTAKVVFGSMVLHESFVAQQPLLLGRAPPFLWVAAVPFASEAGEGSDRPGPARVARLFLVLLAMLQVLQAYPVCGTQVGWSTFLLLPIAALCLADAARFAVERVVRPATLRRALRGAASVAIVAATIGELAGSARRAGDEHARLTPLGLPGTGDLRLPEREVALYRWLVSNLAAADAFYSWPGMNSLWFWTGKEPPTPRNVTSWLDLLTPREQREVVSALERHRRVLLAERRPGIQLKPDEWSAVWLPLAHFMRSRSRLLGWVGEYQLSALEGWETELTYCAWQEGNAMVLRVPAIGERPAAQAAVVDLTGERPIAGTNAEAGGGLVVLDESGAPIPFSAPERRLDLSKPRRLLLRFASDSVLEEIRRSGFPVVRLIDDGGGVVASAPFLR